MMMFILEKKIHLSVWIQAGLSVLFCLFFSAACTPVEHGGADLAVLPPLEEPAADDCSYFYFMWGKSAELEGRFDEAREAYEKSLVCDPEEKFVTRKLANLLIAMGKREQAAAHLEQMIAHDPEDLESLSVLANLYGSMDRVDDAVIVFAKILALDPEDQHTLLRLGVLYARNKEYSRAREVLEQMVDLDPDSFMGHSYLAKLFRELKYYDKAFDAYEKALQINWAPILAYEAAELYESRKRFSRALEIYQRLLEEDETNPQLYSRLSRLYIQLGLYEKAVESLHELREYITDTTKIDMTIARLLLDLKQFDRAADHLQTLVEDKPRDDSASYLLAVARFRAGDRAGAKAVLKKITPDADNYEAVILLLLQINEAEEDHDASITLLEGLIADQASRQAAFYPALASLYWQAKDPAATLSVMARAVDIYPDDSRIWYEYGMFLERAGQRKAAMSKVAKSLKLDPENPYALNFIGYNWADQGIHLERALDYISRAVKVRPHDGFIRDSLGWVYYRLADYQQAIKELQAAIKLEPQDPTIHDHLGDSLLAADRPREAMAAYENALTLYEKEEDRQKLSRKMDRLKAAAP